MSTSYRLELADLHAIFLSALGDSVINHGNLAEKPLDIDLRAPLPQKVRLYMFNATSPPGGRTLGERKIQLIIPGQNRGQRGNFDYGGGRLVLLVGYESDSKVLVFWDAGLYVDFAFSSNLQVKAETIFRALAGVPSTQRRRIRGPGGRGISYETVVAAKPNRIREALQLRFNLSIKRITGQ